MGSREFYEESTARFTSSCKSVHPSPSPAICSSEALTERRQRSRRPHAQLRGKYYLDRAQRFTNTLRRPAPTFDDAPHDAIQKTFGGSIRDCLNILENAGVPLRYFDPHSRQAHLVRAAVDLARRHPTSDTRRLQSFAAALCYPTLRPTSTPALLMLLADVFGSKCLS
jgi:hypothetical protein